MRWLAGAPCASWPTTSTGRYTGPWDATTKNPILLIGTRFDPTTPVRNARLAERRLGNAVLIVHDGYGHLTRRDPSTCITQAMGSYLVNLTTHPPGPSAPLTASRSTPTSANPSRNRPAVTSATTLAGDAPVPSVPLARHVVSEGRRRGDALATYGASRRRDP